ncbi:transcription antitermination factor NusB [Caulobacter sp. 17J65-9]|uniref:transcription antitermination factor NusB n=1 Tax=Caulobacter sp. 17J65-9 TaxID=2709382 RepID=UPI0013CC960E|nr:transcription antitermination factor NusB [Caulobacter sp. 17J65-9]NEX92078.1 transcription antitermination factor NusB [Caulobacter sp. 17J65-9]
MTDATPRPNSLKEVIDHLNAAGGAQDSKLSSKERRARTVARLAAVQALYQMEMTGAGVEVVIREFSDHRFQGDLEGETLADADEAFFAELVRGVVSGQAKIDAAVTKRLASNWRLERIDATLRAVLRAGVWELAERKDVPTEVAIDEYVEIAKAFFDEAEAKFVNAALDGVSRDVRA